MFGALDITRVTAKKYQLTEAECALRWIVHHPKLKPELGHAIIIGASTMKRLEANLEDLEKGSLPGEVVEALDKSLGNDEEVVANFSIDV